jgi:hypothetical protein
MRGPRSFSWLALLLAVGATASDVSSVAAQPNVRDHRHASEPTEAPPPPRAEKPAAKAGFVWIDGSWDWRDSKWTWIPGHWEREKKGKRWRADRWEQRGGHWQHVAGAWEDAATPPPPVTPPPATTAASGPTEAPPPPRQETPSAAKPGFVWITGAWDWRDNKWTWIPGHWEREKAGKRWRADRWEQHEGHWQRVAGGWEDASTPPPPVTAGPTEAPPPPRAETPSGAKPGFVWIAGAWDWRDSKWDWIPGHWEREKAGQRWRPQQWEQREGRWQRVEGGWEPNTTAATPPPPVGGRPHHEWKLDKPVVARYWPAKGKAGTKVVINGKNFPANAEVMFGGQPVKAAKVTADKIAFVIPAGAASGEISVRAGGRRALSVGTFEVAANFDAAAEQKRLDEEARKQAAAQWTARQRDLAKDRAAREAALQQRLQEREASREQRRQQRIAELQAKWERAFLADDDTQGELTLHAQRVAELQRMEDLAEVGANEKLGLRILTARQREDARHEQRMTTLRASFQAGGAQ